MGPQKTNPSSGREEDLNRGPTDYKSSILTTRPQCFHYHAASIVVSDFLFLFPLFHSYVWPPSP